MNILLVSLLRVGDIFLILPIIKKVRKTHPDGKIFLLINSEFAYVSDLLEDVDEVLLFPRSELQEMSATFEFGLFSPAERLEKFIGDLNQVGFDKVVNLTHNKLSAHLMSLIQCENKLGMSYDKVLRSDVENDWFRFLNDRFYFESRSPFHYMDTFGNGATPSANSMRLAPFSEMKKGEAQWNTSGTAKVLFQISTSDEKKNWSLEKFKVVFRQCQEEGLAVGVLCAPGEREHFEQLLQEETGVEIFPTTFAQAFSYIEDADLLVTLDTSIKHLASLTDTPVLELALGSANPYEVGVRKKGQLIVMSQESCVPCRHSVDCHRAIHACGISIDPYWLSSLTLAFLKKDLVKVRQLAGIAKNTCQVLRTDEDPLGMWFAEPMARDQDRWKNWIFLLRRSSFQNLLCSHKTPQFEERSLRFLAEEFDKLQFESPEVATNLKLVEADRKKVKQVAEGILREFRIGPTFPPTLSEVEQMGRFKEALSRFQDVDHYSTIGPVFESCLSDSTGGGFPALKKIREYMRELVSMASWEISAIRFLNNREECHVSRIGTLLASSIGETSSRSGKDRGYSEV